MTTSDETEACPFCGRSNYRVVVDPCPHAIRAMTYVVRCNYCGATGPSSMVGEHGAFEKWNKRATAVQQDGSSRKIENLKLITVSDCRIKYIPFSMKSMPMLDVLKMGPYKINSHRGVGDMAVRKLCLWFDGYFNYKEFKQYAYMWLGERDRIRVYVRESAKWSILDHYAKYILKGCLWPIKVD